MPWYEWTRSDPFRDHARSREVQDGEVVELPAEVADPNPGFVDADAPEQDTHTDEPQADESEDESGSEDETFRCGVEKSDGEPCGREVDAPEQTCWQH